MTTPDRLQLRGLTHAPRRESYPAANSALTDRGVLLEDMHEYSNRMTTYRFEIDRDEVEALCEALTGAGFELERDDYPALAAGLQADAEGFLPATLQLTFASEDGDHRNENPDRG